MHLTDKDTYMAFNVCILSVNGNLTHLGYTWVLIAQGHVNVQQAAYSVYIKMLKLQ